jgi:hypothetical protein
MRATHAVGMAKSLLYKSRIAAKVGKLTGLLRYDLVLTDQRHVPYAHDDFVVVVSDVAESTCHTLLSAYVARELLIFW